MRSAKVIAESAFLIAKANNDFVPSSLLASSLWYRLMLPSGEELHFGKGITSVTNITWVIAEGVLVPDTMFDMLRCLPPGQLSFATAIGPTRCRNSFIQEIPANNGADNFYTIWYLDTKQCAVTYEAHKNAVTIDSSSC